MVIKLEGKAVIIRETFVDDYANLPSTNTYVPPGLYKQLPQFSQL